MCKVLPLQRGETFVPFPHFPLPKISSRFIGIKTYSKNAVGSYKNYKLPTAINLRMRNNNSPSTIIEKRTILSLND